MSPLALLLAVMPLALVFILITMRNMAADKAAFFCWLATLGIACVFFETPPEIALTASLSGIIGALPIALAMGASGFQIFAMAETGALATVVESIKRVAPTDTCVQMLFINCGFGIIFTAIGAVTTSIFPPILLALGYTTFAAVALPCIGYTGACIYAMMGVPVVIFATLSGIAPQEADILFARCLPFLLIAVGFACLWIAGKGAMLKKGAVPAILAGGLSGFLALPLARMGGVTLTGIVVGLAYILVLIGWLRLKKQPVLSAPAAGSGQMRLTAAISPWIALVVLSFIVNSPFMPFFKLLFSTYAMPVEIIPGRPERLRIFWQSYLWICVATLLCAPFFKAGAAQLFSALTKTRQRILRPMISICLFFAIASLYVYSGFSAAWQPARPESNMIGIISHSASSLFGSLYIVAAPFLGVIGGVISGSQSGSIAMLTKLNLAVGANLNASGPLFAMLSALGGGLSGAIAPAKVMNAASVIGKPEEQGRVLQAVLGVTLLLTLGTALFAAFFL